MRIAVDLMGGDFAPQAIAEGCRLALEQHQELQLIVAGTADALGLLPKTERIERLLCTSVIETGEQPLRAIREKKDSSLVLALNCVKDGRAEGIVSAGSTGAVMSGALFQIGRIKGIHRPALAPILPTLKGRAMLIDCGANPDCKPEYLSQFAAMGAAYMKLIEGVENPAVALINIGTEEEKGTDSLRAAHQMLKASKLNFIGNMEPRSMLEGDAQVLVCDGLVGNIALKTMEGTVNYLLTNMKSAMLSNFKSKLGALLTKDSLRKVKHGLDYTEYGGAPLLGVAGVVIKAHGNSTARSFANAMNQAVYCIEKDIPGQIRLALESSL